ncbi:hypothetical protein P7K49_017528 [Saguinus oedipus]|uniref:Uncharacterized protein n=1 Tax=Saguinus oedipus TaxID=9490 RepID=A0ABQ9V5F7_SAGOE|nr:hypothetical protein P7K49_017528 [Saguinus oedipus]
MLALIEKENLDNANEKPQISDNLVKSSVCCPPEAHPQTLPVFITTSFHTKTPNTPTLPPPPRYLAAFCTTKVDRNWARPMNASTSLLLSNNTTSSSVVILENKRQEIRVLAWHLCLKAYALGCADNLKAPNTDTLLRLQISLMNLKMLFEKTEIQTQGISQEVNGIKVYEVSEFGKRWSFNLYCGSSSSVETVDTKKATQVLREPSPPKCSQCPRDKRCRLASATRKMKIAN